MLVRMILTTTPSIDGRPIHAYLALVTGEAILGANVFRWTCSRASVTWLADAPPPTRKSWRNARETAIREMTGRAEQFGADAQSSASTSTTRCSGRRAEC